MRSTGGLERPLDRRANVRLAVSLTEQRRDKARGVSYQVCYHLEVMAKRHKRSISLPPEIDRMVAQAAKTADMTVSAWIAETAYQRIKLDAGRQGIEEWEAENGSLTPEERKEGREIVRGLFAAAEAAEMKAK